MNAASTSNTMKLKDMWFLVGKAPRVPTTFGSTYATAFPIKKEKNRK